MGILDGKNVLVTGITTEASIAFAVARIAQEQGAKVVATGYGRALGLTKGAVERLPVAPPVLELDVTDADHLASLADRLREVGFERVDGVVHSVAFANPARALGGAFLKTEWPDVATSLHTSAYSLKALAMACRGLMPPGAAVVGLTFPSQVSWPSYDWMGVAKAALESINRYMARYLGPDQIRCNLVSAGPIDTVAKTAIPSGGELDDIWDERAPLGWDHTDATAAAKAVVALLSDWFPATTGQIVYVDGGLSSTAA